ncbi:MAG TPA: hypoxanthine phosphoribosyltransferase [Actinomycetota bacterium]|nr:hypoxanthine phosphoribosyltransferase [Actinomycetota bacterium]
MKGAFAEVRFTADQIRSKVDELAGQIVNDLKEERPVLVAVLKGSLVFMADLSRRLGMPADIDFMIVSQFEGGSSRSGVVRIIKDLELSIQDRHVIVVETIVDTGLTLSFLLRTLQTRGPRSLKVCALIDKPIRRIAQPSIDYVGFQTDEYLVGYGLDFQRRYRNLPYLVGVKDVPALAAKPEALWGILAPADEPTC